MSEYYPDNWVVLKLKQGKLDSGFYKVLAGWSGGYLDGDSWRMNSGITSVVEENKSFEFYGESGSCYVCRKGAYRLTMATAGMYNKLVKAFPDKVELMPEDTDWLNVKW